MNNIKVKQDVELILTKKSIGWLVDENNTYVKVFNPVSFTGYQRKIDDPLLIHGMQIDGLPTLYEGL